MRSLEADKECSSDLGVERGMITLHHEGKKHDKKCYTGLL
jgi:hypothetical protein